MSEITVNNPKRWFFSYSFDAEWWFNGGATREECIAKADEARPFYIVEAKRMVPNIEAMNLFDGDELVERMQDSEVWSEDGWEGAGDTDDLTRRLNATLKAWFNETCTLDGAQLDFTHGPELIEPARIT